MHEPLTMARPDKVFDRVMGGRAAISFRDFERLLLALGFRHDRPAAATAFTFIQR
jgi:hypothetical protein